MIHQLLAEVPAVPVMPYQVADSFLVMDFSENNQTLPTVNITETKVFDAYVFSQISDNQAAWGIGGYNEHRVLYQRSRHFDTTEAPREIHLGIDLWAKAGTPVFAPIAGRIHSFQDNANFGDYGPTIIIEHSLGDQNFYTLYGHLSRESLSGKTVGQAILQGEILGWLGNFPENGDWPPHLHFQIILDLQNHSGDYPGVCTLALREAYLRNCPDPNLLLRLKALTPES